MNIFKKAFTLNEMAIAIVVIGVFMTLIYSSAFHQNAVSEKKVKIQSHTLYSDIEKAIYQIAYNDTKGQGLESLDTESFSKLFLKHLADIDTTNANVTFNCDNFVGNISHPEPEEGEEELDPELASYIYPEIGEDSICTSTKQGVLIAFQIDPTCSMNLTSHEYFSSDLQDRDIENACGFIAYEPMKNAKGVLGKDFFVIALGKLRIR